MTIHVLHVPTELVSTRELEERWCFRCRRRVAFALEVHAPTDPMSYYGPHSVVRCEHGHADGDCFPGTYREGGE